MDSPETRWAEWPVVVVGRGIDHSNQRVNKEFFEVLGEALARDERFGLVVLKAKVDLRDTRRSEAEREGIRWMKTVRGRIAEQCAGIAYVLAEHALLDDERTRRGIAAGLQVYGCPTAGFADLDAARRWVLAALGGDGHRGAPLDP